MAKRRRGPGGCRPLKITEAKKPATFLLSTRQIDWLKTSSAKRTKSLKETNGQGQFSQGDLLRGLIDVAMIAEDEGIPPWKLVDRVERERIRLKLRRG